MGSLPRQVRAFAHSNRKRDGSVREQPKPRPRTAKTAPEDSLFTISVALRRRLPLTRSLIFEERLCLAIVAARPTHFLTLHTADAEHSVAARAWRLLVRRMQRRKSRKNPLIYFATIARGAETTAGCHVHALLWEFLWAPSLQGQAKQCGFGPPHLARLPDPRSDFDDALRTVAYVVGQNVSVFGTRHHERHRKRVPSKRRFVYPQRTTLALHQPKLLSAIQFAPDPQVSDQYLLHRLPSFSY